jgi:hypothetical protein
MTACQAQLVSWEMRELLARCHTHLDDADQIISGRSLPYHAMFPEAYTLYGERQRNGTGSTVCFETRKHRTTLHLLLRQMKALTSEAHHVHALRKITVALEFGRFAHACGAQFEGNPRLLLLVLATLLENSWRTQS